MIEPLTTEQYLPCNNEELYGTDKRKELPNENTLIGLRDDVLLLPMYKGFKLSQRGAILFVDDSSVALLKKLAHTKMMNDLLNQSKENKSELERLNYYSFLSFGSSSINGKLEILEVPNWVKQLYKNNEFSWFSYFPTKIELDLSNYCNLQCIHCSRDAYSLNKSMSNELNLDELKNIISYAAKNGVLSLQLMGGEPLIYKHFFDICEHAKKERIKHLSTSSNGFTLNREVAKQLAEYFDEIQLSLHGAFENTHDEIVGRKGAWRKIKDAAKALSLNGVKVRLSFTVMEKNVEEIESMPILAKELGASSIRFLSISNQGRGKNLKSWCKDERSLIGYRIKDLFLKEKKGNTELKIQCGGFPPLEPINPNASFYGCPAGRDLLYIGSDGRTSCCGVVEEYVGNIRYSPILELWHHYKMIELRKSQDCNCAYKYICAGPCVGDFKNAYSDKIKF